LSQNIALSVSDSGIAAEDYFKFSQTSPYTVFHTQKFNMSFIFIVMNIQCMSSWQCNRTDIRAGGRAFQTP